MCYIIGFKKRASEVPENMQTHYIPKDHRYKMLPQDESENTPASESPDAAALKADTLKAAARPETEEKP